MKFDLENLNPGIWIDLDEKDPKQGAVCLRVADVAKLSEIRKATTKRQFKFHKGQMHEYYDVDDDAYDRMLWDYCITDWRGLADADGNPIACTSDNKFKLVRESVVFRDLIDQAYDKVKAAMELRVRDAQKN